MGEGRWTTRRPPPFYYSILDVALFPNAGNPLDTLQLKIGNPVSFSADGVNTRAMEFGRSTVSGSSGSLLLIDQFHIEDYIPAGLSLIDLTISVSFISNSGYGSGSFDTTLGLWFESVSSGSTYIGTQFVAEMPFKLTPSVRGTTLTLSAKFIYLNMVLLRTTDGYRPYTTTYLGSKNTKYAITGDGATAFTNQRSIRGTISRIQI